MSSLLQALYRRRGEMRFDSKESIESKYQEHFDDMWKNSKPLPTNKSFFMTIISKLKRWILVQCRKMITTLRGIYRQYRGITRFIRHRS